MNITGVTTEQISSIEQLGYRLKEQLSCVGNFSTYRAIRLSDSSLVTIKVEKLNSSSSMSGRLEHEFNLTYGLEDPGIVPPLALERTMDLSLLVFLDDQVYSLNRYIEGRSMPLESFLEIALQLVSILGRIHSRDIVHKDIKPSNIIIDPDTLSVKLTGFGIATIIGREIALNSAPLELAGTLAYMSPEQTGRMNRSIDYRSDIYSLGITFYEMLAHQHPFQTDDPTELVYYHIARKPVPIYKINNSVPGSLSNVILKMIAKDAENRYQSTCGLAYDLQHIQTALHENANLSDFMLGSCDVSNKLLFPERLYGREEELSVLLSSIGKSASGSAVMVRVSGHSGVGKSSLVREVMRPVAGRRGYFISGKFDQFNRIFPYSAIVQAFDELVRLILPESQEYLEQLRGEILKKLGLNGQVILDVIPSFEQLLGKQEPVVQLGPNETQIRFKVMFRRFISAFATNEHSLVIFLDDLQWADAASFELLEVLMTDNEISNLLLFCAYRDNEIGHGHPASDFFKVLDREGIEVQHINMLPLENKFVEQFVADSLRLPVMESISLAALVIEKTKGNPFFVRQFLQNLHDRELLKLDTKKNRWHWSVEAIQGEQITDNVVELVMELITNLDDKVQRLLQIAACIGNRFDLETLALASGMNVSETAMSLLSAQRQQIIIPIGEFYKYAHLTSALPYDPKTIFYRFNHDKLHHAAYFSIPDGKHAELHERIGKIILHQVEIERLENRLFEVVKHLNFAKKRFSSTNEKIHLARLNLQASQQAKASTAYMAALEYLETGIELLDKHSWSSQFELTFELYQQRAEVYYLLARFDEVEVSTQKLLKHAKTTLKRCQALDLLILTHTTTLQYGNAIDIAVQSLELLGEIVPRSPSTRQLFKELLLTWLSIGLKSTTDLRALPRMLNPEKLAAMQILMLATPPAYFDDPNLMPYLALRMVRLSVKYGNTAHSAYGYATYGLVLCGVLNAMKKGEEFGQLAINLIDDFNAMDIKGKVIMVIAGFIKHWNERLHKLLPMFEKAALASIEYGDLEFHGYNRYAYASYSYFSGITLARVAEILEEQNAAVRKHKHEKTDRIMQMARDAVRDIRGIAAGPQPYDLPEFDEKTNLELWIKRDRQAFAYFYLYMMNRQFMRHDFHGCLESASIITTHKHTVMGMIYMVWFRTFESLALTALIPDMGSKRTAALLRVQLNKWRLWIWSKNAPENYLQKYYLVTAELERVRGNIIKAESAYEEAIRFSRTNGALHDLALSHELAGQFQLARGQNTAARAHLQEAQLTYRQWGAFAWAEQLEKRYASIFGDAGIMSQVENKPTMTSFGKYLEMIDLTTISNSARAISSKMRVEDVLKEVLESSAKNAGASRGMLLLNKDSKLIIEAEFENDKGIVLNSTPFTGSFKAPTKVINYTARTMQTVVLDDSLRDDTFSIDPYISEHKPLSILCSPIIDKGNYAGLLYLENNLVKGAFTRERIQILDILTAQAAISLENARLYRRIREHVEELESRVKERTHELENTYQKLREIFGKYLPKRIVQSVMSSEGYLQPIQSIATILYSDIQGFASISEHMHPEQILQMLNEYFSAVLEPIDRNGGVVHQFQGDAMLVTFNIPIADPHHADKAMKTAIEIQRTVNNRKFAGVSLKTTIGINTGNITAGNVGSGDRFSYTVHGDAVNLSSRIEQLNKEYRTYVLVSGTTKILLKDDYQLTAIGKVNIRGKTESIQLYYLSDQP